MNMAPRGGRGQPVGCPPSGPGSFRGPLPVHSQAGMVPTQVPQIRGPNPSSAGANFNPSSPRTAISSHPGPAPTPSGQPFGMQDHLHHHPGPVSVQRPASGVPAPSGQPFGMQDHHQGPLSVQRSAPGVQPPLMTSNQSFSHPSPASGRAGLPPASPGGYGQPAVASPSPSPVTTSQASSPTVSSSGQPPEALPPTASTTQQPAQTVPPLKRALSAPGTSFGNSSDQSVPASVSTNSPPIFEK